MKTIEYNIGLETLSRILEANIDDVKEEIEVYLDTDEYLEESDHNIGFDEYFEEDGIYDLAENLQSSFNVNVNIHTIAVLLEDIVIN